MKQFQNFSHCRQIGTNEIIFSLFIVVNLSSRNKSHYGSNSAYKSESPLLLSFRIRSFSDMIPSLLLAVLLIQICSFCGMISDIICFVGLLFAIRFRIHSIFIALFLQNDSGPAQFDPLLRISNDSKYVLFLR